MEASRDDVDGLASPRVIGWAQADIIIRSD
jgi:hypothetical protein